MLDQKIRVYWDRGMSPVGRGLGRIGLSANAITVLGVFITLGGAYLVTQGRLFLAAVILAVAAVFDVLDGAVAKATGSTTRFGALLDSTTDRLGDASIFAAVAWLYGVDPDVSGRRSLLVAGLALATMIFAFLVSYVKARAEGLGYEANVGFAERAERMIVIILGLAFDRVPIAIGILCVASFITFLQRLLHVRSVAARGP